MYDLMQAVDSIQASCTQAEYELATLRKQTGQLFADAICAAHGISDPTTHQDIAAAWCDNPYAALDAFGNTDAVTASNPYGCNQYGHEWRGKHGEGWKPGGRGADSKSDKKKTAQEENEKSAKEEAKEWNEASPEKRQDIMQRWKNKVRKAKQAYNDALDYKKEGEEEYENTKKRRKADLDKAIEEFEEKVIEAGKLRNWSEKQSRSTAKTLLIPVI